MRTAQCVTVSCKGRIQRQVSNKVRIEHLAFLINTDPERNSRTSAAMSASAQQPDYIRKVALIGVSYRLLSITSPTDNKNRAPDKSAPISSPTSSAPQSIKLQS